MEIITLLLLSLFGHCLAFPTTKKWTKKEVCVIGGGASGTYAAVRLQQMGVSVALVEKEGKLGGMSFFGEDFTVPQKY